MTAGGPVGQLVDDRFELVERLGGGGMGFVWRARDIMLHREVALKEVRAGDEALLEQDPHAAHVMRERVLREARALARLHHPNVVTIYHIVDSGRLRHPWLVMELVTGGSLADRLEHGPLPPHEAARIGRGLLAALSTAHAAGIQHRDIKPANVLLRPDGTPVLTDFGIAALRESTSALTTTGALVGSPEYFAPERLRGQEGDPASDLWSLGMLLYVAVEGHNPMRRDSVVATLMAVLDAPIPAPVLAGPLTPALAALLVRDPAARPTAAELDRLLAAAQLGTTTAARPGVAPPPGAVESVPLPPSPPRPPRRRRNAVLAGCLAAAVLLGLTGALLWTSHGSSNAGAQGGGATRSSSSSIPTTSAPGAGATTGTGQPSGTGTTAQGQSLLTTAGMEAFIAALRSTTGGTTIVELHAYTAYADVEVPTKADPTVYNEYSYRDGALTAESNLNGTVDGEPTVNLATVNWSALPTLVSTAENDLKIAHPTDEYLLVGAEFDSAPTMRVYVTDAYDRAGFLVADLHGHITRTVPYGS